MFPIKFYHLPYNLVKSRSFAFSIIGLFLLVPFDRLAPLDNLLGEKSNTFIEGRNGNFLVEAQDEEAKIRALFISDVKRLLRFNQAFYNTYGHKDAEVDNAFEEARIAAEVIHYHPEIFRQKLQDINNRISEALLKAQEEENNADTTADGV